MTFLELCVSLRSLGAMQGSGPNAVTGQTGESLRIVTWIRDAWLRIQNSRGGKWNFLSSEFSKALVSGTAEYEFYSADGVKSFDNDSFQLYKTADGVNSKYPLRYVPYKEFRNRYLDYSTDATPFAITITPSKKLKVYPAPDDGYTLLADAFDKPVVLAANGDTPAVSEDYHMMIVYRALIDYSGYEESSEIFSYAGSEFARLFDEMVWGEEMDHEECLRVIPQ